MLAKRVIPCMDVKDGRVVKGVNFVNLRDAGDPIELAQRYDEQRADEVIFLDITATSDDRVTTVELASRASEQLHLPLLRRRRVSKRRRHPQDDRGGRRQGVGELCRCCEPRAHHAGGDRVRHAGDPLRNRRETAGRQPQQVGSLCPRRPQGNGNRRRRVGARGGAARRGRDPAHEHGP